MVTAKDGAPDPRIATATVTVSIIDIEDEVPSFGKPTYEALVPENIPDYFIIEVKVVYPNPIILLNLLSIFLRLMILILSKKSLM